MATWRGPSSGGSGGGNRGGRGRGGGRGGGGGGYHGGGPSRGGSTGSGSLVFSPPGGAPAPDAKVAEIENSLLGTATGGLARLSLDDTFPRRPSYGTKGKDLVLWANYYTLKPSPQLVLYRYTLSVTPAATGRKLEQIVRLFLQSPDLRDVQQDVVTDFKSTLIARQKIQEYAVKLFYRDEGEDEPREHARDYTVKLELNDTLPVADLISYLTSTDWNSRYGGKLPVIQALNILVNHHAKSSNKIATPGTSKSFPLVDAETYDLEAGLKAIRGFFTSVRAATGRILLNVNVSHSAFYHAVPLDDLIRSFLQKNNQFKLASFLPRLRVRTTHLKERKNRNGEIIIRAKTIYNLATRDDGTGLDHPPRVRGSGSGAKDVEFWLDDHGEKSPSAPKKKRGKPVSAGGRYISIYDYFKSTHNIQIREPSMPVLNVGTKENPSYLPAQVCVVLPGQPAKNHLSPSQTQRMIQFAVRGPADNANSIVSKGLITAGVSTDTSTQLNRFGATISPSLITVQARLLVEPKVVYGRNKQAYVMNGSWNMVPRDSPSLMFSSGTVLQSWSCLYIDMPTLYPHAHQFTVEQLNTLMKGFRQVLASTGVQVGEPFQFNRVELKETDDPALEEFIARAAKRLQLLFVILPASPIPVYNRLKQLADVKYGIHTICSVGSKIAKSQGQDQYFRNEALKVNLKLGGDNQLVQPERLGLVVRDKTMIVGIDVTHPSPGSSSFAPSVSAMVASINPKLSQWPGTLSIQARSRQEMVSDLTDMLKSRLALWRQKGKHTAYPENIVVYRDGVSEGQYSTVIDDEEPLLRKACKELYPASDQAKGLPRFAIVIVGKRHHTRFYVTKETDADRSGNSKAGTVVDRGVTEARSWDFFLQSHAAIKGTARPAHYFVVLDEIFRSSKTPGQNVADELQMLTQSMCYVFGRATKAVSYCAPAYYADILCERARRYLSHVFESPSNSVAPSLAGSAVQGALPSQNELEIHDRLKNTMFYI
ncbi:ribonuclease H-like domain-containing protein [Ustulina deusta]|nr:ribonuclease H-like domain-containing protein [Ustulina deusta]